ncbi:MAG: CCA tRNA nucleotidyltransferase, partial [Rhizobiales bacterium]|nr:CCA tRNA nucleotidyltransferase [Hyphomicrobiales bacterium]
YIAVRRVRFIGEARERIREDYLRILRFFRFHAAYGHGAPDPAGLHAAIAERAGLSRLSRERVRMEWMKLLAAAGVVDAVRVMADAGFVGLLLGNVPLVDSLSRLVAIEAQRGIAADPVRRLAALCVVVTEDAERLREQLRLSNAEHERLAAMAQGWWRVGRDLSGRAMRALLFELGPQAFADRVMLAWARDGADPEDPDWNAALGLPARWAAPRFPVRSADLVARGVPAGPALGAALAEAQSAWIAADFPDDPASFERIAAAAASRHRGRG